MDRLLKRAQGLYLDRQRIALSAFMVVFVVTLYMFYSPGIVGIAEPPEWFPPGWSEGLEVVASFNTVGFLLAFAVMVFAYGFWQWAFLPTPAVSYTRTVLAGIFGRGAKVTQTIGKRFRVFLDGDAYVDVTCRIRGQGSGNWFAYRLTSSPISRTDAEDIALRHGMSVKKGRFTTWISNEELHSRTLLLAKAMYLALHT
ncbi:MAG: hypothetical protein JSW61_10170 [Candidatus Thorarchaeota archaeon]|nr:MAG: hypothetical protein JSW61_10170 [Candidatus Thorarchaeota archaeon]